MKRILLLTALALFIAALTTSCSNEFKVTYLEICPTELTTTVNDTVQLTFSLVYEGGDFNDPNLIQVEWSSSDVNIVEASDSGVIVTKAVGIADVTVTCQDMSSTSRITVIEDTTTTTDDETTQSE